MKNEKQMYNRIRGERETTKEDEEKEMEEEEVDDVMAAASNHKIHTDSTKLISRSLSFPLSLLCIPLTFVSLLIHTLASLPMSPPVFPSLLTVHFLAFSPGAFLFPLQPNRKKCTRN